jgi:hypothetical protein
LGRGSLFLFTGRLLDDLYASGYRIDIFDHMILGPDGKPGAFVDRTESTPVPWAVPCDTDKEALGLAGGTDRTLLKSLINFLWFAFHIH